jgi:hypothetical protein
MSPVQRADASQIGLQTVRMVRNDLNLLGAPVGLFPRLPIRPWGEINLVSHRPILQLFELTALLSRAEIGHLAPRRLGIQHCDGRRGVPGAHDGQPQGLDAVVCVHTSFYV